MKKPITECEYCCPECGKYLKGVAVPYNVKNGTGRCPFCGGVMSVSSDGKVSKLVYFPARNVSKREAIRMSNASGLLPGMESQALDRSRNQVHYLQELIDKLIEGLNAVHPMSGTAHKGECPACRRHLALQGHLPVCPIAKAVEAVEAYTIPSGHTDEETSHDKEGDGSESRG